MITMQKPIGRTFAFSGTVSSKKGIGGKGGRKSDFLNEIRAAIQKGEGYAVAIEPAEGETFGQVVRRYTSRLRRKGAIHDANRNPLPFVIRSDPDAKEMYITPPNAEAPATAAAAPAAGATAPLDAAGGEGMNVQLPHPEPGETLEVKIGNAPAIIVSHKQNPPPTVEAPAPAPAKNKPGRPAKAGKR